MTTLTYTTATPAHIPSFLKLQEENLLANTPAEKLAGGFVTTPFTVAQLEALIAERGLFVAVDGAGEVQAYVVSASWQYLAQWPIFEYMVTLLPDMMYADTPLTAHNTYQYGPICIAKHLRGSEVLPRIFVFAREQMAERYPISLTFVNKKNQRSYEAHRRKLGLDHLRDFAFNGNEFYLLGFKTK